MRVEVQLYATLRKYGPPDGGPRTMVVAEGERLGRVLEAIGIPADVERVILVNGRPATADSVLEEGDRVVLYPPVAGG